MTDIDLSRREILTQVGAAGVGAFGLGTSVGSAAGGAGSRDPLNRHIVGVKPGKAGVARRAADEVYRQLDFGEIGQAVSGWYSENALDGLRNNPNVRYIEAEGEMHAIAQTLPWGVDRVDADMVHADGETGGDNTDGEGGANIAIIDTGIDSNHPDLEANLGTGYAVVNARGPYAEKWDDDNGHGTHCAGIADAINNEEGVVGVSTAAMLHAVKVLDNSGSGSFSDVAEGIQWVADQGYDVGSMSLGASSGSSTVQDACQYAVDKGVLLVAAAGNSGPCTDCVGFPAAYSTVIAVSAIDQDDSLASYSSTGPEIELAAPGTDIYSTYAGGGYDTLSGTSMACPHVSGAGGQLMDNGYSNSEARDQLKSTAEDIGLVSNEQGNGLLDVEAAMAGSGDSDPTIEWVNPTDGETVSGSVSIQIDASDSEDADDSLTVDYRIDSGSWRTATYNSTSEDYEDSWDSTTVDDGDHNLDARATDTGENTSAEAGITISVDNTTGGPMVDSLSLSEDNSGGSPHADFDASWSVSDGDGDLDTVELTLTDLDDGETEDSVAVDVSGSDASGTTDLKAQHEENSENEYEVELVVTDANGNMDSGKATEIEDGS